MTDPREERDRKIANGRDLFVRREAGDLSDRMSSFVKHADQIELVIPTARFEELLRTYEYLRALSRGEEAS